MSSKMKRIFKDNWFEFKKTYSGRIRQVVIEDVERMINCGDYENGYAEYSCMSCSETKKVAFTCKSRFCTSCGKIYVDNRAEAMSNSLIKVNHRHMVFTIPEELRIYFKRDRKLLNLLPQISYDVIKSYFHNQNKSERFTPGVVSVIHTFGRDLKWNPHVHLLVTEGCSGDKNPWKQVNYFHYERLRKSWQKLLLDAIEKTIQKGKRVFKNLKFKLYSTYKDGFYVYGDRRIKSSKAATRYVGRYTGRPAIADSRIIDYNGDTVTYYYDDHTSGNRIEVVESVFEFIKKVIIHIANRNFKMIRYYGIYSNKRRKHCKIVKMVHEKLKEVQKKYKSWRKRMQLSFGHDPLLCPKCNKEMILTDIVYPKIGSVIKLVEKRLKEKIDNEVYELEENYEIIKKLTNGEIEPLYV